MRTVLRNHDEVAHYWANQIQSEGRASRMFFEGSTIYSYGKHFPIAKLIIPLTGEGQPLAAFTTSTRSLSTSRHITIAKRAASHLQCVSVIAPTESAASQYAETLAFVNMVLGKRSRARTNAASLMAKAYNTVAGFNRFAEARGETVRITADLEGMRAEIDAYEAQVQAAEAESNRRREIENAEQIAAWLSNRTNERPYTAKPLLRLMDGYQGTVVETSFGADIPVADAQRLWPVIQRTMAGDRDYEVGMELGGYKLTRIRKDGSIVVGCHDIAFEQIERVAELMGMLTPA